MPTNAPYQDTIYALATPQGRSGVAILRISGVRAFDALATLTGRAADSFEARKAYLCNLYDGADSAEADKALIDQALVIGFRAPASFTGEDVVELQPHGSPAVLKLLLEVLSRMDGLRMAEPGEFTRRGFENGKMDLTEAEAVADLIHAETHLQRQQALQQMGGALGSLYEGWSDSLKRALAHVEADLEFPDEDMPDGILPTLLPKLSDIAAAIDDHLNDNNRGERLRDGVQIAVIGAPNAGKSTLVNQLAKRDVAIVSDVAGTTRDVIEVHLDVGGYPVILADTAGLRPDQVASSDLDHDRLEHEGIKRALQRARSADIRLVVFDAGENQPNPDSLALCDDSAVIVVNKCDSRETLASFAKDSLPKDAEIVEISAAQGTGLDALLAALLTKLESIIGQRETPSLTRERHRSALEEALSHITRACNGAALPELAAEDLRLAVRCIGRITGRVDVEDLLDVIFRDFCIGK